MLTNTSHSPQLNSLRGKTGIILQPSAMQVAQNNPSQGIKLRQGHWLRMNLWFFLSYPLGVHAPCPLGLVSSFQRLLEKLGRGRKRMTCFAEELMFYITSSLSPTSWPLSGIPLEDFHFFSLTFYSPI